MTDIEKLQKLGHLQNCHINWCEGMGSDIYRIGDMYILFDVSSFLIDVLFEKII
jgi:hypothetical protein